jgi:hypothetical protein
MTDTIIICVFTLVAFVVRQAKYPYLDYRYPHLVFKVHATFLTFTLIHFFFNTHIITISVRPLIYYGLIGGSALATCWFLLVWYKFRIHNALWMQNFKRDFILVGFPGITLFVASMLFNINIWFTNTDDPAQLAYTSDQTITRTFCYYHHEPDFRVKRDHYGAPCDPEGREKFKASVEWPHWIEYFFKIEVSDNRNGQNDWYRQVDQDIFDKAKPGMILRRYFYTGALGYVWTDTNEVTVHPSEDDIY